MTGLSSRFILYKEDEGEDTTNRPTVYEAMKYHNFIEEMLGNEVFVKEKIPESVYQAMLVARDTLCWTLGHDSNGSFPINLGQWSEDYAEFLDIQDRYDS